MIYIGKQNHLIVSRISEYGAYLSDIENSSEVLLPTRYCSPLLKRGDEICVFVYTDSEDRPVATTEKPLAFVGEFAFLVVEDVTHFGAFLDWGLAKNLLVPFSEQKSKMKVGGKYLVYVYLDDITKRVVASAKIEKYLGNVIPEYHRGNKVSILVIEQTSIGYRVIVDNLHRGMIYANEMFKSLKIGEHTFAYVKSIRDDGKIDLTLTAPSTEGRVHALSQTILRRLKKGNMMLTDNSPAELIKEQLHCSKRDFKKTIGALYREHRITINSDGSIRLVTNN